MPDATAPVTGQPAEKQDDLGNVVPAAKWRESFEDADIKGSTSLDKFTGTNDRELLGAVAKSYINLEKMPRGVTAPKDGAPQTEWDAFYEKLGRPKTAEEYGIELKVPENLPWNKDAEARMLKAAHGHGLTKKQAEGLLNDYVKMGADGALMTAQAKAASYNEAETAMRQEWGGLADQNVALVQRAVTEFGSEEFKTYLEDTGLGNNALFLKFVHNMARPMLEDGMIQGEGLGLKRVEAQAEIDALMKDPRWLKGDKDIIARIHALYPIANGGDE